MVVSIRCGRGYGVRDKTISTKCGARNAFFPPLNARRSARASAAWAALRNPAASIRAITVRCRRSARSARRSGLNVDGRCGRPARNAACATVSMLAGLPK